MKMNKTIAALLALLLLCGCGSTAAKPSEPAPEATPTATVTEAPAATEATVETEAPQSEPADALRERYPDAHILTLACTEDGKNTAALDGTAVEEFDYVWHADPSEAHDEVKNCPAEYFTGTAPETDAAAYITHDVYYYPALDTAGFQKVNYDGEQEWAYYYTAEEYADYIFATLPVQDGKVPEQMMHSEEEAYGNAVLNITEPGTYVLSGTWHGQVRVDLGDADETFTDENAKVTLVLCGADVECSVAPSLLIASAYECDNCWEDRETHSGTVDTADAGAVIVVADGTENSFTGANVYRMLKTKYKNEDDTSAVPVQKKARKTDAAVYSYVSMNVEGEAEDSGVLNVTSTTYEGLDTELHLTVNGGSINVFSQDDGINVNEDGVSVFTMNGGSLHILAGLGSEGDGIDSNGYLTVNGGTLISAASPYSDSGMDSDCGTCVNGGTVLALGSAMDWAESDGSEEGQAALNLQFAGRQDADEAIIVTDGEGTVVFAYDPDKDEVAGGSARFYQGAILSAPGITVGGDYCVYVGGDVEGEETAGVYDPATVTGFSTEAKQQGWNAAGGFGSFRGGQKPDGAGMPPDGSETGIPMEHFDPDQPEPPFKGAAPDDEQDGTAPMNPGIGFEPPSRPQGTDAPTPPEGMERPEDGSFPQPPDGAPGGFGGFEPGSGAAESGTPGGAELVTVFTLTGKVNFYSGVGDAG